MSQDDGLFLEIQDKRCIFWLHARVTIHADGTVVYNSPDVEEVAKRMVSFAIILYIYSFIFTWFALVKH